MPNIITHALFAQDLLNKFDAPSLNERTHLFQAGANGPDFLFFHNVPFPKTLRPTPLRKIAGELHQGHVNEFYASALESIRNEKNPDIREDMTAYACGHLAHWALDSVVHPYVYYKTGNCSGRSSWNHHRYESLLDAIMLKVKKNQTIQGFDASRIADCSMEEARAVSRIYVPAVRRIFSMEIEPHQILESLNDWESMQKVFRDPSGSKIRTARFFEKGLGISNLVSGYSVPAKVEDNVDLINLKHQVWHHPVTGEESDDSVFDLYQKALHRASVVIRLFLESISDPSREKSLLEYIDDRDYDTGMKNPSDMQYFDLLDLS